MHRLLAAAAVIVTTACGRTPAPEISLAGSPPSAIEVRGLPTRDIAALSRASLTTDAWEQILRVQIVAPEAVPIAGAYAAVDGVIRFSPMYGFDAGRSFAVTFDASRIPGADPGDGWRAPPLAKTVSLSGPVVERTTVVRQVYPSAAAVPANMLCFYIEFSAPMGRGDALEHIRLVDEAGQEVADPFLPVEAGLWTPDHTRFTLFFDPGRVKRDIKPNRDLGRALIPGKRYALVIGEKWLDGRGQPLKSPHRHEFTVGNPIEKPLDQAHWKIVAPTPGTRDRLIVNFPWALDYGLLQRTLGVRRDAADVPGDVTIAPGETRWSFTPEGPWSAGDYTLFALTSLEDPAVTDSVEPSRSKDRLPPSAKRFTSRCRC